MIPHELAPYFLIGVPLAIISVLIVMTVMQSMLCILRFDDHVVTINHRGLVKSDQVGMFTHAPVFMSMNIACDRCGIKPMQWPVFFYPARWVIHYNVGMEKSAEFIELATVMADRDGLTIQDQRQPYSIGGSAMPKAEANG